MRIVFEQIAGYVTADLLASSPQDGGVELVGKRKVDVRWQANTEGGSISVSSRSIGTEK